MQSGHYSDLGRVFVADIAAVMRQFHTNYNNNEIDKSGDLVVDDVIADINGGAGNNINGVTHRFSSITWYASSRTDQSEHGVR